MDRRGVIIYLNGTMSVGYGKISMADARMMSAQIKRKVGGNIAPEAIIQAALNSPVEMLEKYKTGLWHALIREFNVEILTLGAMEVNGVKGEQIIGYR